MEKDHNRTDNTHADDLNEAEIMNRVNQTYDKITQEVKSMLDDNQQNG